MSTRRSLQRKSSRPLRFECLEGRRVLATFVVTSDADAGPGSLREAIEASNLLPGADEIVFDPSLDGGQIRLSSGTLEIDDSLMMTGPAAGITIDAQQTSTVLSIGSGDTVSLSDMTITDGYSASGAGGIFNGGGLTLTRVTISENESYSGGISCQSGASVSIYDSTVTDNLSVGGFKAGGVDCGTVTVHGSSITNNRGVGSTGGISGDVVTITDSTLTGNIGSGSLLGPFASAIAAHSYLSMQGSTVSHNLDASEPGYFYSEIPYIGGAIVAGNASISDSVIAYNSALPMGTSDGTALYVEANGSSVPNVVVANTEFLGNARAISAPRGGLTVDESSFRNGGGVTSASRFFANVPPVTITDSVFEYSGVNLRAAATLAMVPTFYVSNSTFHGGGIDVVQGQLFFVGGTISGSSYGVAVSGHEDLGGGIVEISNAVISGNQVGISVGGAQPLFGGSAYLGFVRVQDSQITDNSQGARVENGTLELSRTTVANNSTSSDGAGILGTGSVRLIIEHSTLSGNTASSGGAIALRDAAYNYASYRTINIAYSTISQNSAVGRGGGLFISGPSAYPYHFVNIVNTTISGNSSSGAGGGIYVEHDESVIDVESVTVTNNSAGSHGGGIGLSSQSPVFAIDKTIVSGNQNSGGASPDVWDPTGKLNPNRSLIGSNQGSQLPEDNGVQNLIGGPVGGHIDARLWPLADNGGPTHTHALLVGSPAINSGGQSTRQFDQRGFPRVVDGSADIGAYEGEADIPRLDLSELSGPDGFTFTGSSSSRFGHWSASAGDINGDGFDDWIVGAQNANSNAGAAYVLFGKPDSFANSLDVSDLNGTNGFAIPGLVAGDLTGSHVGTAGDINGDGLDDFFIVAGKADPFGRNDAGAVYVVFGSMQPFGATIDLSTLDGSNGFLIPGILAGDFLGSAGEAGDLNGDGLDDFAVGAWRGDAMGRVDSGRAHVIYGTTDSFLPVFELTSLNGVNGFTIRGAAAGDGAGHKIAAAGDVDGDGLGDLLVGALLADPNGAIDAGVTYLLYGKETNPPAIDLASLSLEDGTTFDGLGVGDESSTRISSAGDVNGDGRDDIFISAFRSNASSNDTGEAFVVFGADRGDLFATQSWLLDGSDGFRVPGVMSGDLLGLGLGGGGDLNGDGFDDLVVTARNASGSNGADSGLAYVIFGGDEPFAGTFNLSAMETVTGLVLEGAAGEFVGDSAAFVGDLNGDGYDDLTVSSATANRSYLVWGRNFSQQVDFQGTAANDLIQATNGDDTIVAGQGDDVIQALGATEGDVVRGGQGDDFVAIGEDFVGRIVGGSGIDELALPGGATFDLVALPNNRLVDVEAFDLSAPGANLLRLSHRDVLSLSSDSNTVVVSGTPEDTIVHGPGWTSVGTELIEGRLFRVYEQGHAILKIEDATLQVVELVGDFDGDLQFTCADVDPLVSAIVAGTHDANFDLTLDGQVDHDDLQSWLVFAGLVSLPSRNPFQLGDANLDGVVDGADFVIWNAHKFTATGAWCQGDFNADGNTDGSDFLIWNEHKFTAADRDVVAPIASDSVSDAMDVQSGDHLETVDDAVQLNLRLAATLLPDDLRVVDQRAVTPFPASRAPNDRSPFADVVDFVFDADAASQLRPIWGN